MIDQSRGCGPESAATGARGYGEQDGRKLMATITIRYFGPARDAAGMPFEEIETREGATVGEVADMIAQRYPRMGSSAGVRLAVNRSYSAPNRVLIDGDEIAVIPPVSGG